MTTGSIYNIMIGSPSDVGCYVKTVIECINHWNVIHSIEKRIALIPHHWTTSSYPSLSNAPQEELNQQLVSNSDALIAILGTRMGTPTDKYISGTAEEIELHRNANKPVMVLFCEAPANLYNCDIEQFNKVREYRDKLFKLGLCATFTTEDELRTKLNDYLHRLVQDEFSNDVSVSNIKEEHTISFSEEEIDIIKKWCACNNTSCSVIKFMGGGCHFRFGCISVDTHTGSEYASMQNFIARMVNAGLIEIKRYDKHGNPIYELQLLAYQTFGEQ